MAVTAALPREGTSASSTKDGWGNPGNLGMSGKVILDDKTASGASNVSVSQATNLHQIMTLGYRSL